MLLLFFFEDRQTKKETHFFHIFDSAFEHTTPYKHFIERKIARGHLYLIRLFVFKYLYFIHKLMCVIHEIHKKKEIIFDYKKQNILKKIFSCVLIFIQFIQK